MLQSALFAHHGCDVLAVDLPGHGRSDGAAARRRRGAAPTGSLALLDAAGVERAALVGHSMGSLIALEAAARAPARASTQLALVGTAYPMKVSPALLDDRARARRCRRSTWSTRSRISTLAAKPSSPGPGSWLHGATAP